MRDTSYATELVTASVGDGENEVRLERLFVKPARQEEIRISWWKDGRLAMRPLDVPEEELNELFRPVFSKGVFTIRFALQLAKDAMEFVAQNLSDGDDPARRSAH